MVSLRNLVNGLTVFLILPIATVAMTAALSDLAQNWNKDLIGAKDPGKVVVSGSPAPLSRKAMIEGFRTAYREAYLVARVAVPTNHLPPYVIASSLRPMANTSAAGPSPVTPAGLAARRRTCNVAPRNQQFSKSFSAGEPTLCS